MPRIAGSKNRRRATRPQAVRRRPMSPRLKTALTASLAAFGGVAILGFATLAWVSGWVSDTADRAHRAIVDLTVAAGFSVEEVLVRGRRTTDGQVILAALDAERGDPILWFDPHAARLRIEALPWVRSAVVERRLPDTVFVSLEERRPLALWQLHRQLQVIDAEGAVLAADGLERYAWLPMVVGEDAPRHAPALLAALRAVPVVAARVHASVRVAGRRWDLRLDNGVAVQLPAEGVEDALQRLASVEAAEGLFDRDIVAIDMRLHDRIAIRLSPTAGNRDSSSEENT